MKRLLLLIFVVSCFWPLGSWAVEEGPPFWVLKSRNLRDLGGWTRLGWGPVKRGLLYRSRALDNLSPEELEVIRSLHLKTIVDFRTSQEIEDRPDFAELLDGVEYYHIPMRSLKDVRDPEECQYIGGRWSEESARCLPQNIACQYVYRVLANIKLFKLLLRGAAEGRYLPALLHCEYGIDRVGTAAAFLLYAMGVTPDEILADYLASEEAYREIGLEAPVTPLWMETLLAWFRGDRTCTNVSFEDLFFREHQGTLIRLGYLFKSEGVLIPAGASWKYNDYGPNINADPRYAAELGILDGRWRHLDFDDGAWKEGVGVFGFSPNREKEIIRTEVLQGAPVYYFRKIFEISNKASLGGLKLRLWADDGAVVFLNGQKIVQQNVPQEIDLDNPSLYTHQITPLDPDDLQYADKPFRFFYREYTLSPALIREGRNIIAVQVYQSESTSSDLVFDLELLALPPEGGLPAYTSTRLSVPQILAAGFDPAIVPAGEAPVRIWALVRAGTSPVGRVEAYWQGRAFARLEKAGILGNGDEIWILPVLAPSWAEGLLYGSSALQLRAFGSDGAVSAVFPGVLFAPEGSIAPLPPQTPSYNVEGERGERPQLLACGFNPSVIPWGQEELEVLAVVRPGSRPLQEVVLLLPESFPLFLQKVGQLPNGDLIYAVKVQVSGSPGQFIDPLSIDWTIKAYDDEGGESNPCFTLERF